MQTIKFSEIKTTYYFGGKTILTPSWNSYDVICPASKLYFVTDGELIIKINGLERILKKGDVALIPAGVKHSHYLTSSNYAQKYWFHFDLLSGGNFLNKINFEYVTNIACYDEVITYFEKIAEYEKRSDISSKLFLSGMVNLIVSTFLQNSKVSLNVNEIDEIDKIISLIETNPEADYSLNYLSNLAHLSPNYFIKKFKEKTGFSPIKYAIYVKIKKEKSPD